MTSPTTIRRHQIQITEEEMKDIRKVAEKTFVATRQWMDMFDEHSPEECFIESVPDESHVTVGANGQSRLVIQHFVVVQLKEVAYRG